MEAQVRQLNKVVLEKEKLLMSKQQMQPNGNVCTEDKIINDEKEQVDSDLSQKDKHILRLEMQLVAERQHTKEYRLKYTMTTKVRFPCTE
jgi:CRISPR/Cas system CMR subunit Cmr6 (Cas7 group RAMP superfamily)